ncbi:MAG: hypothetical protein LBB37_03290 [Endomicrobium sp.]|jgi:hypothetical protein|nr:hypothetical protein [Endomicrobium sp.]
MATLQTCNGSEDCQKLNELYIEFQVWLSHLKSKNKIIKEKQEEVNRYCEG